MNRSHSLLLLALLLFVSSGSCKRVFPSPGIPPPAHYDYCQANLEQAHLSAHLRNATQQGYELVQVQVVFRHGDRTPLGQIRKTPTYTDRNVWKCWADEMNNYALQDPVGRVASELEIPRIFVKTYENAKEPLAGNCGFGELTPKGVSQHNQLGAMFRELYVNQQQFMPGTLDPSQVYIRAGDEERLLHSAQAQLRGLYPTTGQSSDPSQVVEIVVRDGAWDNMTPNTGGCETLNNMKRNAEKSSAYQQHKEEAKQQDEMLKQAFGVSGLNKFDVVDLIRGQRCHNMSGFYVMSGAQQQSLIDWEDVDFCWFPYDQETYRLGIGSFIGDMWEKALEMTRGEANAKKWVMWSGHDSTLVPVLRAMGVFDGYWPPYASHMVWELWKKDGQYYMYLHYNGATLTTPTCSQEMCPLKQFSDGLEPIIPFDVYADCAANASFVVSSTSPPAWQYNM